MIHLIESVRTRHPRKRLEIREDHSSALLRPSNEQLTRGVELENLLTRPREGLVGDYDYAFLFKPNLPFMAKSKRAAPFFGLNDKMPVMLALLLGFQHALSMLAGIITPPIIISGQGGANLGGIDAQYLVSTSLIVSGILSSIQITRFHIYKSPYYIGTGLISVVGTSFAVIPGEDLAVSQSTDF